MSSRKLLLKNLGICRQISRLELSLRLSRLVEGFEYAGNSKNPVDGAEMSMVLRSAIFYCQRLLGPYDSFLSTNELKSVIQVYIWLHRYDKSSQYMEAKSLCECVIRHNAHLLSVTLVQESVFHLVGFVSHLVVDYDEASGRVEKETGDFHWLWDPLHKILSSTSPSYRSILQIFCSLTRLCVLWPRFGEFIASSMFQCLISWLQSADILQAAVVHVIGDIPTKESSGKSSQKMITELDQSPFNERFTILNIGKFLTSAQLLHVELFSCVKVCLHILLQCQLSNGSTDCATSPDNRELYHAFSDVSAYLLRLLEQCENQWRHSVVHRDLLQCCLIEIVDIMQPLCQLHPPASSRLFPRSIDVCRTIMSANDNLPPVFHAKILPFFYQQASRIGQPSNGYLDSLFAEMAGSFYKNNDFAHEMVHFLRGYTTELMNKNDGTSTCSFLARYFPAISKLFIWNPFVFLEDYQYFLPTFLTNKTILELLHYLLDLPCIAACMEYSSSSSSRPNSVGSTNEISPQTQRYLIFFLRSESGTMGDTLANMTHIYNVLTTYRHSLRVLFNCDMALSLLPIYLDIVFSSQLSLPEDTIVEILRIIFERSTQPLFGPTLYVHQMTHLLGDTLSQFFRIQPQYILKVFDEVLDFIKSVSSIEVMLSHYPTVLAVLHALGQCVSSLSKVQRIQWLSQFMKFYELLECRIFEWLSTGKIPFLTGMVSDVQQHDSSYLFSLLGLISSCLMRISVVYSDRQARCIMILSKMQKHFLPYMSSLQWQVLASTGSSSKEVMRIKIFLERLNELIEYLKFDNMDVVLSHIIGEDSSKPSDTDSFTHPHRNPGSIISLIKGIDLQLSE